MREADTIFAASAMLLAAIPKPTIRRVIIIIRTAPAFLKTVDASILPSIRAEEAAFNDSGAQCRVYRRAAFHDMKRREAARYQAFRPRRRAFLVAMMMPLCHFISLPE